MAGLGDLYVTSAGGRNSKMGYYLGQGHLFKDAKEKFMKEVSRVIVKVLDPFRKAAATRGKIQNTEDFKHLAKKVWLRWKY